MNIFQNPKQSDQGILFNAIELTEKTAGNIWWWHWRGNVQPSLELYWQIKLGSNTTVKPPRVNKIQTGQQPNNSQLPPKSKNNDKVKGKTQRCLNLIEGLKADVLEVKELFNETLGATESKPSTTTPPVSARWSKLATLEEVLEQRMLNKPLAIMDNTSHPLHYTINILKSKFRKRRYTMSFLPSTNRILNTSVIGWWSLYLLKPFTSSYAIHILCPICPVLEHLSCCA